MHPRCHRRYPDTTDLFLLNGNSALPEIYFHASRFLPLLVELIADDHGSDGEHPDGEIENVTIYGLAAPENGIGARLAYGRARGLT